MTTVIARDTSLAKPVLSSLYAAAPYRSKRLKTHHFTRSQRSASSASPDEMAHFARLSNKWWDEDGEFGLLHRMNPSRVQFLYERLVSTDESYAHLSRGWFLENREVLDVGCGGGVFTEVGPALKCDALINAHRIDTSPTGRSGHWCGRSSPKHTSSPTARKTGYSADGWPAQLPIDPRRTAHSGT